jgi:alpha/beta superfamily hydrolase
MYFQSLPKKVLFALFLMALSNTAVAQLPYTEALYTYDSIMDHAYGSAVDYAGNATNLTMDIYTPNNAYCNRPIAVLVHGGAWIAGSKEDVDLVYLSRYFAKRGYVVANINYRLGTHKAANYTMYPACNTTISAPCGYISDSAEVYRANFRAMQDVKGAIRYMKSRYQTDSSDYTNVYLVGQSAGGFVSLAAAFMHDPSEKPANCGAIADAPLYDPDLVNYGCVPNPISFARPDLGSVDGSLHVGSYDASVRGVANIFGGMMDPSIADASELDETALYLFHQGSDVVVHYNYGRLLGRTSYECYGALNVCQPYYFYPFAYGSKGIANYITGMGITPAHYLTSIVENYEYTGDCFDNGHSFDAIGQRAAEFTDLFAEKIESTGNQPSAQCNVGMEALSAAPFTLFPNPAQNNLRIQGAVSGKYVIFDVLGSKVAAGELKSNDQQIDVSALKDGLYFFQMEAYGQATSNFIVKH